jgi:hypothetical protein
MMRCKCGHRCHGTGTRWEPCGNPACGCVTCRPGARSVPPQLALSGALEPVPESAEAGEVL